MGKHQIMSVPKEARRTSDWVGGGKCQQLGSERHNRIMIKIRVGDGTDFSL